MKKMLLLAAIMYILCSASYAQDSYHSGHYSSTSYGINGFRTVSEENAYMEQVLAERRRLYREENGIPEESSQAQAKRNEAKTEKSLIAQTKIATGNRGRKPVARQIR